MKVFLILLTLLSLLSACGKHKSKHPVFDNSNFTGSYQNPNPSAPPVQNPEEDGFEDPVREFIEEATENAKNNQLVNNKEEDQPPAHSPLKPYLSPEPIQDIKEKINHNRPAKLLSQKVSFFELRFFRRKKGSSVTCEKLSLNKTSTNYIQKITEETASTHGAHCYLATLKFSDTSVIFHLFGKINHQKEIKLQEASQQNYKISGICQSHKCKKITFDLHDSSLNGTTHILYSANTSFHRIRNKGKVDHDLTSNNIVIKNTHWVIPFGRSFLKYFVYKIVQPDSALCPKKKANCYTPLYTLEAESVAPGLEQVEMKITKLSKNNKNNDLIPTAAFIVGDSANEGKRLLRLSYPSKTQVVESPPNNKKTSPTDGSDKTDDQTPESHSDENTTKTSDDELNENKEENKTQEDNPPKTESTADVSPAEDNDSEEDDKPTPPEGLSDSGPTVHDIYVEVDNNPTLEPPTSKKPYKTLIGKFLDAKNQLIHFFTLNTNGDPQPKDQLTETENKELQEKLNRIQSIEESFHDAYQTEMIQNYIQLMTTPYGSDAKRKAAFKRFGEPFENRASLERVQRYFKNFYRFRPAIEIASNHHSVPTDYSFLYFSESLYFTSTPNAKLGLYPVQDTYNKTKKVGRKRVPLRVNGELIKASSARGPGQFIAQTGKTYGIIKKYTSYRVSSRNIKKKCPSGTTKRSVTPRKGGYLIHCISGDDRIYFTSSICATSDLSKTNVQNHFQHNPEIAILAYYLGPGSKAKGNGIIGKMYKKVKKEERFFNAATKTNLNFREVLSYNVFPKTNRRSHEKVRYAAMVIALGYISKNIEKFEHLAHFANPDSPQFPSLPELPGKSFTTKKPHGQKGCVNKINSFYETHNLAD